MASLELVELKGEKYFKIENCDSMRPFFMSIVSDSNHWMFISSNGGLTAGRKNSEYALFPYYTDDKITESQDITGSKTIIKLRKEEKDVLWEPFSTCLYKPYAIQRNLYKSRFGNKIIFEEINHDLELTFRYQWNSSNLFGFLREAELINNSENSAKIHLLDGLQNILPQGVGSDLQNSASNLVDAYKRTELIAEAGLGIYALNAIISDKAEPSESLKANVAWSYGLEQETTLISSYQLATFVDGGDIQEEADVRGRKGAYLMVKSLDLDGGASRKWGIVCNVNQSHAGIVHLLSELKDIESLRDKLYKDIDLGTQRLVRLAAAADGVQHTERDLDDARHYSNVMFNIMRGGIFDVNYDIERRDFMSYIRQANTKLYDQYADEMQLLPEVFDLDDLKSFMSRHADDDLTRLGVEYLPLIFSRRHGDPSRPWNEFSINTRSEIDGSKIMDYQGNWRDIFQNWEALAFSFPKYIHGMIYKFLNASTFDGYNPYRVFKDGFDWEVIEPDDPWSYIGYWGDHQLIYLLKFLEFVEDYQEHTLEDLLSKEIFVYAAVPYRIKSYQDIVKDPKDTIVFDEEWDKSIRLQREKIGADGALHTDEKGEIIHVNFLEKIMATLLAKLSNFIADGGIWLNTQRPEWNDANNALVGNGVSVVTLCYLRRFLAFMKPIIERADFEEIKISTELVDFYHRVREEFQEFQGKVDAEVTDEDRRQLMDSLGMAASDFRNHIYNKGFWGKKRSISKSGLVDFFESTLICVNASVKNNKREDNLFHAYNLVDLDEGASISYLYEMLEGQVAALSSGLLDGQEALHLLDALRESSLYRQDQNSYILYPNRDVPGYLEKNIITEESVSESSLLQKFLDRGGAGIIERDLNGNYHFKGEHRNQRLLREAIDDIAPDYKADEEEIKEVIDLYERIFNHKEFTGRSGTFFGYEGLGSIYWHMVSKLLLAVQECVLDAQKNGVEADVLARLIDHYYEIKAGIGVYKPPEVYGAFPTDPYSHTPAGKGAQQPGMTGQVKEDILSRWGELGVELKGGKLSFNPTILRADEFLDRQADKYFIDLEKNRQSMTLAAGTLAFSYCQVPVVYKISEEKGLKLFSSQGQEIELDSRTIDGHWSNEIFNRTGKVSRIEVNILKSELIH